MGDQDRPAPFAQQVIEAVHPKLNAFDIDGVAEQLREAFRAEHEALLEDVEYLHQCLEVRGGGEQERLWRSKGERLSLRARPLAALGFLSRLPAGSPGRDGASVRRCCASAASCRALRLRREASEDVAQGPRPMRQSP